MQELLASCHTPSANGRSSCRCRSCCAADGLGVRAQATEGGACTQKFLEDEGWACRLPGIVLANQVCPVGVQSDQLMVWKL